MQGPSSQQNIIQARLPFVAVILVLMAGGLVIHLANFQFISHAQRQYLVAFGDSVTNRTERVPAERGLIYDRDMVPLAFNIVQYRLGASPNLLVWDERIEKLAKNLGGILDMGETQLYTKLTSDTRWELLAAPITAEQGQAIKKLDEIALTLEKMPKRFYPQNALAAHVIGFVLDEGLTGVLGVEGAYNDTLAGRVIDLSVSRVPLDLPEDRPAEQRGQDIVLTLDRDVQFWVEAELAAAVQETDAFGGTIIVMDPRNGDVLALANYPSLNLNNFMDEADPNLRTNAAINQTYEPGTLVQVLTVAGALETGAISPSWTYNDGGLIVIGGRDNWNWNYMVHGISDASRVLTRSLRAGAATIALEMGAENFYATLRAFGLGQLTGVGLFAEERGELKLPGDTDWNEARLGTNAYGQELQATPMQLITAFAAIANDGIMRQPRIVKQVISEGGIIEEARPATVRRVISAETAGIIKNMLVRAVLEGASAAYMPDYTIAGIPGTANIGTALEINRNFEHNSIVSFIGFIPAAAPQAVVMVKLDQPKEFFAEEVAAPIFKRVADRLVILLEIPDDEVRARLAAAEAANSGE